MHFKVSPVVGKTHPLFQVTRVVTGAIHLVTNTEFKAYAMASNLHDVVEFKASMYAKAGFHYVARCMRDPRMLDGSVPMMWIEERVGAGSKYATLLDNNWTAQVRQADVDDMVELDIVDPAGVSVGKPVLFHTKEEAMVAALGVYLRRFPKELTREIFLD